MSAKAQFVVLFHATPIGYARPPHWDFMLERDGLLLTWALPLEPADNQPLIAERLDDHRLGYLDFEGPVAGGRGEVARWDRGEWELLCMSDGELTARLKGDKLAGRVTLTRDPQHPQRWRFLFLAESTIRGSDEPASP